MSHKAFLAVAVLILDVMTVFGQSRDSKFAFPPISLASTETAQVNVANIVEPVAGAPQSCVGSITFYDSTGSSINAPISFKVGVGQTFSAKLAYSSTKGTGPRVIIRSEIALGQASVTMSGLGSALPRLCRLSYSLETWGSTSSAPHSLIAGPVLTEASDH